MFNFIKRIFGKGSVVKENLTTETPILHKEEDEDFQKMLKKARLNNVFSSMNAKKKGSLEELKKSIFQRTTDNIIMHSANSNKHIALDAVEGMNDLPTSYNRIKLDETIMSRLDEHFIGWTTCAILKQNWLIDRACKVIGDDASSVGYHLELKNNTIEDIDIDRDGDVDYDDNKKRSTIIGELEASSEKYKIKDILRKAEEIKRTFGYSLIFPVIDGVDMSKPFTEDAVKGKKYHGLTVVEPMWVVPELGLNGLNPASTEFYEPEWYKVNGVANLRLHKSWVVKLVNNVVPDILKPTYYWGGIPLTQQIYKRVYCAEAVANEAPMLAMTKRTLVVKGDMDAMIANPDIFEEHMKQFTELRDNFGVAVTQEGATQLDTSLDHFSDLTMTQYNLVASIAQIPVSKLMKVEIRGFDSAGEYERTDYLQHILQVQNMDFTPIVNMHNMIWQLVNIGEYLETNVVWNKNDTQTEKELAETQYIKTQRLSVLVNTGVISKDEARDYIRTDENSGFSTIQRELDRIEMAKQEATTQIILNEADVVNSGSGENQGKKESTYMKKKKGDADITKKDGFNLSVDRINNIGKM